MGRLSILTLGLAILGGSSSVTGAQTCGFPWTVTARPFGPDSVAVDICGHFAGCQPHDPRFSVTGSHIQITLLAGEAPDRCQCLQVQGTFQQTVVVGPLVPGDYDVTTTLLDCGRPTDAGAATFTFAASAPIPTLDLRGAAALVTLLALVALIRLRG